MRQPIEVIGVPFALGGSKSGPASGPAALIARGLMSHLSELSLVARYTDIRGVSPSSNIFSSAPVHSLPTYSENAVREVTRLAGAHVFAAHRLGRLPVVIGGDHSVSLGTLPQFLYPAFSYRRKVGLLWLDAHYDAHTPKTSHSHYANGFPFASALGHGNPSLGWYRNTRTSKKKIRMRFLPQHTLHIGAGGSDCEPEEVALLTKLGVKTVTMADMSRTSMGLCMKTLAEFLASVDDVICTFDLM